MYLAAAKVGGIHASDSYPADFLAHNLAIALSVIEAGRRAGVERLLFLGSSCIYPKHAPQSMPEEALLTGALEPTNEPYALAKISGIKLCESDELPREAYHAVTAPRRRHLNVGSGEEIAIGDLARLIAQVVGYDGALEFDPTKPDGAPRKLVDSARLISTGWRSRIGLAHGLEAVYAGARAAFARAEARL